MSGANATASRIPELSVVVACDGGIGHLPQTVDAIVRACNGIDAEIVVAHSAGAPIALPDTCAIPLRTVTATSDLVPVLWGSGVAQSRGVVVALTTTQFRVEPEWATALLHEISAQGVAGVGGRMAVSRSADALTRAAFFLRYSEHMGSEPSFQPRDIAGDNAAYVRNIVVRDYPDVANGFWEVDAHRLMRSTGEHFGRATKAVAVFEPEFTLGEMIRNRFVHGGHFGAYRVRALGWPRWRALAVTPLVPFVLLQRILARVRRSDVGVGSMLTSVPLILVLLFAWAAGEARGAISAAGRASEA